MGVIIIRASMPLRKTAESPPVTNIASQQPPRRAREAGDANRHAVKEACNPQVHIEDRHRNEQYNGVPVQGVIGLAA